MHSSADSSFIRQERLHQLELFVAQHAAEFRNREGSFLRAKLRTWDSTEEKKWYNFLHATKFTDEENAWLHRMYETVASKRPTCERLQELEVFVSEHARQLCCREGTSLRDRLRQLNSSQEKEWYDFLTHTKFSDEEKAWVHRMYDTISIGARQQRLRELDVFVREHATELRSRPGISLRRKLRQLNYRRKEVV